jgi:hypothetical protein
MDFQSAADAVLTRSDTANEDDVCRPIMIKTGLAPISKAHSNKLRRKRRFTQQQLYQLWLQEIQHVMVWMSESHAENVTDKTTAIGNTKNLEEAVVSSNNRNRIIDDTPMSDSRLPEVSDANLGELPEIACTQSRALFSARRGRSLKSEQKRAARDQARARQCQKRQHTENALALAERTQHNHTADVLETMSLCTNASTTSSTDKIALIHMLHAANTACCVWRGLMLLIWCYQQQGNTDGNNAQSCSSQRDDTEATSATDVWITSLPRGTNWIGGAGGNEIPLPQRPQQRGRGGAMGGARMQRPTTDQMDMDQISITSGQSVTTTADPDEIQAQMALLALQSLANSSSLKSIEDDDAHSIAHSGVSVLSHVNTPPGKSGFMSVLCEHDSTQWMQAKIIHDQERPQFDQALQYPEMLYAVVSGMVQIYAQILLPTQADGNTGQPLPPPEWQLTHDGQARVTVVGATEVMSRNNRPANIPHPLEPIAHWCELDEKPSPSEYPKIVRPPRV